MTLDESRLRPVIRLLQISPRSYRAQRRLGEEGWYRCGAGWRRDWDFSPAAGLGKPIHTHPPDKGLTAENLEWALRRFAKEGK